MSGSTSSSTTHGIGVSNAAGDCYLIVTDSGARLQAGDYSISMAKSGGSSIRAGAGTITITASGDKGAGIYVTGNLYHRTSESDEWKPIEGGET